MGSPRVRQQRRAARVRQLSGHDVLPRRNRARGKGPHGRLERGERARRPRSRIDIPQRQVIRRQPVTERHRPCRRDHRRQLHALIDQRTRGETQEQSQGQ